jgi:hypothetical protein
VHGGGGDDEVEARGCELDILRTLNEDLGGWMGPTEKGRQTPARFDGGDPHPCREKRAGRLAASRTEIEGPGAGAEQAERAQSLPQFGRIGRPGSGVLIRARLEVHRVHHTDERRGGRDGGRRIASIQ